MAAVGIEIALRHPFDRIAMTARLRRLAELRAQRRPLDEVREARAQRVVVVRRNEQGGIRPQLAQGPDVAENQRAARERRFEHAEPERLVIRG